MVSTNSESDPFLWLEDISGEGPLEWVKQRNEKTKEILGSTRRFEKMQKRLLEIFDSDDRIPYVSKRGHFYYNYWMDKAHPKGVWRRTTFPSYCSSQPDWELLLDVDQLAADEGENWVYQGVEVRYPDFRRALVSLSRGGADAAEIREFDLDEKSFVSDGYYVPEAKGSANWAPNDQVLVATDFGPGTLTSSGYPRTVRLWSRGGELRDADVVLEGEESDVSVGAFVELAEGYENIFLVRSTDFYNGEIFLLRDGQRILIDRPTDSNLHIDRGRLYLRLTSEWTLGQVSYPAGSLLTNDLEGHLNGERDFDVLFEPTSTQSLESYSTTRHHTLINVLDNVVNKVSVGTLTADGWIREPLAHQGGLRQVSVSAVDRLNNDTFFMTSTDHITPATLAVADVGGTSRILKQSPRFFESDGLAVSQHWATSKDGTRIPYFEVGSTPTSGAAPTLLYGYGGFEISMVPNYSGGIGSCWTEKGGTYVEANIRGGGEFGPDWHKAALRNDRHRAYEDFIAVAEDLIRRGVTTSRQLGILGGSNGGLLMGNMYTHRPDLFGAVIAQVPLLDMRRYHLLLAGASWMAEYGDPDDPEQWDFIRTFSPYHNLDGSVEYPRLLVTTSTRDDRVHPGHARKFVARLQEMQKDVLYYENTEGGHAGASDNIGRAYMWTLSFEFLWQTLVESELNS